MKIAFLNIFIETTLVFLKTFFCSRYLSHRVIRSYCFILFYFIFMCVSHDYLIFLWNGRMQPGESLDFYFVSYVLNYIPGGVSLFTRVSSISPFGTEQCISVCLRKNLYLFIYSHTLKWTDTLYTPLCRLLIVSSYVLINF